MHKNLKKVKEINNIIGLLLIVIILVSMQSCKTEYEKTVESELASGITYDSLILDLRVGQTKKEFYKHCWAMNKAMGITAGSGNKYAMYVLPADSTDIHPDKVNIHFFRYIR